MARYCNFIIHNSQFIIMLFPLALALTLIFSSCQEGHEAGDLLGQWKREGADNQYIAFSSNIVLLRSVGQGEVFGNFQHVGDSVFIQCYSINGDEAEADKQLVEETFDFKPFNNIRLRIATLNGNALVLTSKEKTWNFKAY